MLHHVGHDPESTLRILEVPVLDSSLDNIERRRDNKRGSGTGDGCNKVLRPGRSVVVGELVEVLLRNGRSTEQL